MWKGAEDECKMKLCCFEKLSSWGEGGEKMGVVRKQSEVREEGSTTGRLVSLELGGKDVGV